MTTAVVAGGGPENVFLVVNANSESSKTIANYYVSWRKIPPSHVFYVDWKGDVEWCSFKKFRRRLLTPALEAIGDRGLSLQIDYLIYSSDFPWRLDIRDLFPEKKPPPNLQPYASLTGATYLCQLTQLNSPLFVSLATNWYVPGSKANNHVACQELGSVVSRGFRSRYVWAPDGTRIIDNEQGQRYLLSTMLGVTSGRGNSVNEVLVYLHRAVQADGTHPRGTVYFAKNGDIRSRARHACYDEVAAQIVHEGVRARVVKGQLPKNAKDVVGMMVGAADFDLKSAGNTIMPGAICEHLTSLGGVLKKNAGQTPLSEFLRVGAAGASGTVIEPTALQAKFPLPTLHLHYVRGCSLAEAFYQATSAPFQLLIVGDPLCQPWAIFPKVQLGGVEPGQEVHGTLTLVPSATAGPGRKIAAFEFFVDGRLVARSRPGLPLSLNSTKLPDGYHELRAVGVDDGPAETQGRKIVPIRVNNRGASIELSVAPEDEATGKPEVRFHVRRSGPGPSVILSNGRELARLEEKEGDISIATELLGRGPVALQAVSEGEPPAVSAPVWIHVR